MSSSNYIHLKVKKVVAETEKAFLLRTEDDEEYWIPKNQMADPDDYKVNDKDCEIAITDWIANQKGLTES